MKKIILKSLSLVNFKGVRELNANFSDEVTLVCGENGTGKTTLYDAYLWLLFGKDSVGRGDGNDGFSVKTLGEDGRPILRLEHSVTGVFVVDGRQIKLQRCLVEKWRKQNGTDEETMKDESQFFINDVRTGTKKEFDDAIGEIFPESIFRLISNPYYFASMPADAQKDMLLEMVGTISDEDVAKGNDAFMALLDEVEGTTLAKYAKEVAAKKKGYKDALLTIPASIETAQKLTPQSENWAELEKELREKQDTLKQIDAQLTDLTQAANAANERKIAIQNELSDKRVALSNREAQIKIDANAAHNKAQMELSTLENTLDRTQRERENKERELEAAQKSVVDLTAQRKVLADQFTAVTLEQFVEPAPGSLNCPTCGEPLKGENLKKSIDTLRGNFTQHQSKRLADIQSKGKPVRAALDRAKEDVTRLTGAIANLQDTELSLKGQIEVAKAHIPAAANVDELIANDAQCVQLKNDIAELTNRLNAEVKPADVSELQETKSMLNESIAELNRLLGKRDVIARCEREIAELEEKRTANNQAITTLEKWEATYQSFLKAKDEVLMERINGMFQLVSFSFTKEQKNGGEKITCLCTVNGIPYPAANFASKVNAGLDIINALCKVKGITAPIFIDNRESFNEIIPTHSQVINLRVSKDKSLTIS